MKASVFMSVIRSINHLFNSYLSWIVLLMAVLAYMLPAVFSWTDSIYCLHATVCYVCDGVNINGSSLY